MGALSDRITVVNVGYRVSLVLDDGSAFTGDLTPPGYAPEAEAAVVAASWRLLAERGARQVYPGHGPIRPMGAEHLG